MDYPTVEPLIQISTSFSITSVLISQEVWEKIEVSSDRESEKYLYGYTYGGHPTGCLVAKKVLAIIERDKLLFEVQEKGNWLRDKLHSMLEGHPSVREVRGRGLMWGIELNNWTHAEQVYQVLLRKGVRIGLEGRTLTILPPYNISTDELETAVKKLAEGVGHAEEA